MSINWASFAPVFWLVLGIVFAVAEGLSVQLVSIWFAVGAAVTAAVAALTDLSGMAQFWIFLAVSALLLIGTRPLARRMTKGRKVSTNADSVIGQVGVVLEGIDNDLGRGRVKMAGLTWAARSRDFSKIPEGVKVRALAIDGVKLIVERYQSWEGDPAAEQGK